MKGIPLRVEIGPKDMEQNQCVLVRRDNREKTFISLDDLETAVPSMLEMVQKGLFDKAKKHLEENIHEAHSLDEMQSVSKEQGGFVKSMWCGDAACEEKVKEVAGLSSRCIPFQEEQLDTVCPCCGKPYQYAKVPPVSAEPFFAVAVKASSTGYRKTIQKGDCGYDKQMGQNDYRSSCDDHSAGRVRQYRFRNADG